jgi:hypothetical protein
MAGTDLPALPGAGRGRGAAVGRDSLIVSASQRCSMVVLFVRGPWGGRVAAGHPLRQRRALRQSQCFVQSLKALGLVAPARDCDRAHQAGPSPTERPARAHAPDPQEGGNPSTGLNSLQQQDRFDAFVREFNTERPHEALDMRCPAQLYTTSTRHYDGLPELTYPFHDRDVLVTACGRLCLHRKRINISLVLAGQKLGIKEVDVGCGQPAGVNRRARLPSDLQPNFAAIDPRRQQFFLLRRQVADLARSDPRDVDADVAAGVSHVGPRASAAPPFLTTST